MIYITSILCPAGGPTNGQRKTDQAKRAETMAKTKRKSPKHIPRAPQQHRTGTAAHSK
eukprot:TRINITY_DN3137_c0_g1_i1.p3 TRINITY_DN3137_c0_g1~~TRINITY_DN3137_c0_g1_i1.p3  ORF type:complete len:58 (+),score=4.51 TRINITY_DN3137_c0_g1_i1:51-224(+)